MQRARFLEADLAVRYWEDASVDGRPDIDGSAIPLREGDSWRLVVDLDSGAVRSWPKGTSARVCYKVCDEGLYWLLDADSRRIARWKGSYVPDEFLSQESPGFGDYVQLSIGPDGFVSGWRRPPIDPARWALLPPESEDAP